MMIEMVENMFQMDLRLGKYNTLNGPHRVWLSFDPVMLLDCETASKVGHGLNTLIHLQPENSFNTHPKIQIGIPKHMYLLSNVYFG